ncbi:MAG: hypothetical protein R3E62_05575 [Pseudomonadales bacterium]|jgi:putative transposase
MSNHIHFVLEPGKDAMDISVLMKRVNSRQIAYVNKPGGLSGALWERRYKASLCYCYDKLNPVKVCMVS